MLRSVVLVMLSALAAFQAMAETRYCSDCTATREFFRKHCDYVLAHKRDHKTIFIGGYYARTLVAGYRILGDRRYLDAAVAYADKLLTLQSPRGYWPTGYGDIYLADTGSALGLFIALSNDVEKERQQKYFNAVKKYVTAIEADGLINPSGALGTGWRASVDGKITAPYRDEYTISSALTGGEIFTWMYYKTSESHYREVAYRALRWIFGTMREDGKIPYVLAGEGSLLAKAGDRKNDKVLWEQWPYDTSAYVGEGLLSFDLYSNHPSWRSELDASVAPQIEWVLRTQNPDGSWAVKNSSDQKRSPGVVNLLIWYDTHVKHDPRIVEGVRKFDQFLLTPGQAKAFGLLSADGGDGGARASESADVVTALTGRAVADILSPGVDSKW
jgi:hypothetical protein